MTKYFIYEDERWPDHDIRKTPVYNEPWNIACDGSIELTDEEYHEWIMVRESYNRWMERFAKATGILVWSRKPHD